jgi:hypothetical protein
MGASSSVSRPQHEEARLSDQTLKRAIMILATAVAYLLASRLADRLVDQPEVRGVRDDLKEGLLSAASSLALTVLASVVIRRALGGS